MERRRHIPHEVFLLHGDRGQELALAVASALTDRGIGFARGARVVPCRVLIDLQDRLDAEVLAGAVQTGAAVLPARPGPDGWLAASEDRDDQVQRLADAVEALLDAGRPERLTSQDAIERNLAEIDHELAALPDDEPMQLVCDALSLAIERGAPIYNAGSPEGCARIYDHAARAVLARLDELEADALPDLVSAVADELESVLEQLEERGETFGDASAWALRHTFDRILLARHTADAIHTIDLLFTDLVRAGRRLNATLIYDVLSLAISRGAPIYNAGSHTGCARIYLRTAEGLLRLLHEEQPEEGRTETLAREAFGPLVADGEDRLGEDATDLAWDLRHAFDAVIEAAAEERGWEHDS